MPCTSRCSTAGIRPPPTGSARTVRQRSSGRRPADRSAWTPKDILIKVLESWDQIAKQEAAKNAFFRKVYESQRAYASKVVPARRAVYAPYDVGADYYWPEKK